MSAIELDRIIEEVRQLGPDEKRRVREVIDGEDRPKVQLSGRSIDLSRELRWIEAHRALYAGQWVAVRGDRLLSSGANALEVYEAARAAGDERPFVTRVEPPDELTPIVPDSGALRPFGLASGHFPVPDDFDEPLPESVLRDFEG